MKKTYGQLTADDLYSLEQYSQYRSEYRKKALAYQTQRRVALGGSLVLCFENKLTVQYQLQEVLRAARVFERERIESEVAAYKPLLPTGNNLKATMFLNVPDEVDTRHFIGVGESIWLQVHGYPKVFSVSDSSGKGFSTVQWLSFTITSQMCAALHGCLSESDSEGKLTIGVELKNYSYQQKLSPSMFASIVGDLVGDLAEGNQEPEIGST